MLTAESIREALAAHAAPEAAPTRNDVRAAVAMILREAPDDDFEVLLIERARREGDPWSGQMAFPGGRREEQDASLRVTAERETAEEVGIELASASWLGCLGDFRGRPGRRPFGIVISAFVYHLEERAEARPNYEVESALWVPFSVLQDPDRRIDYEYPLAPGATFPAVLVGHPERHVVWGLTFRFLEVFFSALGRDFPG